MQCLWELLGSRVETKIFAKISFIFREIFCYRENFRKNFVHFSRKFLQKPKFSRIFAKISYIIRENFRDNESFRENLKCLIIFLAFAKSFAKIVYIFRENFLENEKRRFSRKFTFQPYWGAI
jgi:hypothetical protein